MADKLVLWNVDTNTALDSNFFRNDEVRRNSIEDVSFAIKNESTQYTANDVMIKIEDDGSITPSFRKQVLFSIDEVAYVDVLSVGDIPPTALSREIFMRKIVRPDAVSGSFIIQVSMSGWII